MGEKKRKPGCHAGICTCCWRLGSGPHTSESSALSTIHGANSCATVTFLDCLSSYKSVERLFQLCQTVSRYSWLKSHLRLHRALPSLVFLKHCRWTPGVAFTHMPFLGTHLSRLTTFHNMDEINTRESEMANISCYSCVVGIKQDCLQQTRIGLPTLRKYDLLYHLNDTHIY